MKLCDMILYFALSTSPEQKLTVYINHINAEKFVDSHSYGKFVDFEAVEQFECAKGPKEKSE